jgi:hypothetical protein
MRRQQIIENIRAQAAQEAARGNEEAKRLIASLLAPKTCLSCGAKQDGAGSLPCGH